VVALSALTVTPVAADDAVPGVPEIHVRGNQLVDGDGLPVRLVGVNRSGSEYACAVAGGTPSGVFGGPSGARSVDEMKSWHVNSARVSLNESCWLGHEALDPSSSGLRYRNAVIDYVDRLNDAGLIAILDLHWNAPGAAVADGQQVMADADHAPAFWSSVASSFTGNPGVMFDLYNEPFDISWRCWRSGCEAPGGWMTAGMQQLVDAVRDTGATQPIIATGVGHGNDLSGWLAHRPHDRLRQLVAGFHVYDTGDDGGCRDVRCWKRTLVPIARRVPIVTGEMGQHDNRSDFVTRYMRWSDEQWRRDRSVSYFAWSWDAQQSASGGPSLIESFDGTPTNYGRGFRAHLQRLDDRGEIHRW
jgi:endoglucanase